MKRKVTAGELAKKASEDQTRYLAREVGEAMCHDVDVRLRECIENHRNLIDENEFCIVRIIGTDPLIKEAKRLKYVAWPYLPSPRPNQAVFLYNKGLDKITKRLWVLPHAILMAYLASTTIIVPKEYETMQAWSVAFYKGTFWDYVRHDQQIDMLSEHEYFLAHREELIKAGCKVPDTSFTEPFDFSKISVKQVIDSQDIGFNENSLNSLGEAQYPNGCIPDHVRKSFSVVGE